MKSLKVIMAVVFTKNVIWKCRWILFFTFFNLLVSYLYCAKNSNNKCGRWGLDWAIVAAMYSCDEARSSIKTEWHSCWSGRILDVGRFEFNKIVLFQKINKIVLFNRSHCKEISLPTSKLISKALLHIYYV